MFYPTFVKCYTLLVRFKHIIGFVRCLRSEFKQRKKSRPEKFYERVKALAIYILIAALLLF